MADFSAPPRKRIRGGPTTALVEKLFPSANPAAAVYGVITIGALLTAETALRETFLDTVASNAVAIMLYWLAHAYATMVARCMQGTGHLSIGALGRAMAHDIAIVSGAAVPLLVLLVYWLAGASQSTGVSAAVWATLAVLVMIELVAGLRSSSTFGELVLGVCVGLSMGAGIVALRAILH